MPYSEQNSFCFLSLTLNWANDSLLVTEWQVTNDREEKCKIDVICKARCMTKLLQSKTKASDKVICFSNLFVFAFCAIFAARSVTQTEERLKKIEWQNTVMFSYWLCFALQFCHTSRRKECIYSHIFFFDFSSFSREQKSFIHRCVLHFLESCFLFLCFCFVFSKDASCGWQVACLAVWENGWVWACYILRMSVIIGC